MASSKGEATTTKPSRVPMARLGIGSKGQKIRLLTNHFKVGMTNSDGYFFHYSVALNYEDGNPVEAKGIGRKILDKVQQTYALELAGKDFAYDGEKSLFTIGALPHNKLEFTVVLEDLSSSSRSTTRGGSLERSPGEADKKRSKRQPRSKAYKVVIKYAAKIPMQAITNALRGQDSEQYQEAVRVLDIVLRQHAAKRGCLIVRQSFYHDEPRNFTELGGGVLGCRGFHSSFRVTQGGLSLNMDASTTMIVQPGPVVDFLLANQNARDPYQIDWSKAKKMLKSLRIKASPSNREYKITGLTEKPCKEQTFTLKQKSGNGMAGEEKEVELTVYEYFTHHRHIPLNYSGDFPCINVGKPKHPTFIPLELCHLVSLQRYTKALSNLQRASLVEKSRQKPQERMRTLSDALKTSNYKADPLLGSAGISISDQFTQVEGRILPTPKLKVGRDQDLFPRNGRWNFNQKQLVEPSKLERWAVVNFSARCDVRKLCMDLQRCGQQKGISISKPFDHIFEENPQFRRNPAPVRVEKMLEAVKSKLPSPPQFLLCILPERKNSDLYGPWKRRNLSDLGIVTQCIAPTKINDQYLTNVLLKINAKLGGMNSFLAMELSPVLPQISKVPTIIIGMDVSHGSPGRADIPSIAAVVSSRQWPLISRYRAAVRTQSPKLEMIDSLYKKVSDTQDDGLIRELLVDFYSSSNKVKPEHIIIFRDGVSESQFNLVINIELDQIIEACNHLDENWFPKFTVVVAQKNHHTKFFQTNSPDNVLPGTVIDNAICHPKNNDFYMCAHAGPIGTTRPTHYHVLHDEIGFSADDMQELVHSLSYVYQRSTTAISVVAPICYAHLAAAQMSQFIKFDELSETSSSHGGVTAVGGGAVPALPRLHRNVRSSMFFC
nr:protein argonaute 4A-like [Nicotiana tomentosiformis]XP_009590321.1 protein argonaute 4A-like [Nicotiana tomentosiformis]XP_009590322.1 protein argonaute 4A-like [Nicotiana tomentosiformis]XP_009590324.1 protein argonaute 4A-like [Nicotiana tomentosiformis]XP_033509668.1 protein argonaute 4A-like [Nicotiana tomentosiformis]XP_033509669.1 protein argonaute 4A-like [Nicotiana tomentosiformis]XP_033509670.1 protein argonaute 4A-like [Nicotiana tomentosiformis]